MKFLHDLLTELCQKSSFQKHPQKTKPLKCNSTSSKMFHDSGTKGTREFPLVCFSSMIDLCAVLILSNCFLLHYDVPSQHNSELATMGWVSLAFRVFSNDVVVFDKMTHRVVIALLSMFYRWTKYAGYSIDGVLMLALLHNISTSMRWVLLLACL